MKISFSPFFNVAAIQAYFNKNGIKRNCSDPAENKYAKDFKNA